MNIAILSKGPQLYSTQRLYQAGLARGHQIGILDISRCTQALINGTPVLFFDNTRVDGLDAVIPRIGTSVTKEGLALVAHLESMGVFSATSADGLWQARDKMRALIRFQAAGIPIPNTFCPGVGMDITSVASELGGFPLVVKVVDSTHGVGVVLVESLAHATSILEVFHQQNTRVLMQEFIRESQGTDVRILVVAGRVVAAMKRVAKVGEFRSNLHQGGVGFPVSISPEEENLAIRATETLGLFIAGVDILRSHRGPLVLEVNASPGLEGIEQTTGTDVAGALIESLEQAWLPRSHAFSSDIQLPV